MYGAGGGGKPGERFSFFFLRFRSLQGDCDGSSKQAFGGPQPARLARAFLAHSSLILLGDRLVSFTHEQRQSQVRCTATVVAIYMAARGSGRTEPRARARQLMKAHGMRYRDQLIVRDATAKV